MRLNHVSEPPSVKSDGRDRGQNHVSPESSGDVAQAQSDANTVIAFEFVTVQFAALRCARGINL